jgi:molybdenum cofactor guanylyltransferase
MLPMFDVQGFILVGGASSRMGEDKARLMFDGQTSVELIAAALQRVTQLVTTVGWPLQEPGTLPNIPDLREKWGPLAGIEAALLDAKSTHCLVVACDFPFVNGKLFERLLDFIDDSDAIVPLQEDGRPQPLCAVYRVDTCLGEAEAAIAAGEHSPRALLDRVRTRFVPFTELSRLDGSKYFFFNVNTPESYQQAQEIFDQLRSQNRER